ncbi:unnamed protein product [Brachionus calyciflorus]|uniref:E3 SUMO-protein ligase RanBP2 n=1 Tax=Brachionus calyciflorus TaxID=104777 RepID=A0A813N6K0_9BILA|nr:unnamed protein product [Brachionus calyciflorus]
MDQRIKNLEDLCELITKEVVDQNKSMIDMNKNLINEIRALREAYVKQDEDFEEFKNLLRKIYELNRQNIHVPPMFPPTMPPMGPQIPPNFPPGPMNNSIMLDQINQSMQNNLSFQTPLNQNQPPNFATLNQTMPSSASAMMKQMLPDFSQPPPSQAKPAGNVPFPPFNQPPPQIFSQQPQQQIKPTLPQMPQQQQQQPIQQQTQPLKFAPSATTTSTPQTNAFAFKPTPQPPVQQQIEKPKPPVFDFSPTKPVEQKQPVSQPPQVKPPFFQVAPPTSTQQPVAAQQSTQTSIFAGANLFKPSEPIKPTVPIGTIPPNIFKLPPTTTPTQTLSTLVTGIKPSEEGEEEGTGNPEEYEPQVEFKPIVKLEEVEVKTGEEEEDVLFKQRCKLYRFVSESKEWKEKGVGDIKLLKHKETKVIRVLMRREQVLKLCANHRVSGEMKLNEISPKQLSWIATDFSENEAKSELLLAKFRTPEEAGQFRTEFEKAVQAMKILDASKSPAKTPAAKPVTISSDKPSLSQALKTDTWKCNACYAPNKKDDLKCACCAAPKPGSESEVKAQEPAKPANVPLFGTAGGKAFSFGTQPQQQQTSTPKIEFSTKDTLVKETTPLTQAPNIFGTQTGILFDKPSMPTFGSLAAKTGTVFGNLDNAASSSPIFKTSGFSGSFQPSTQPVKPLFGTPSTAKTEDAEEEGGDNQNPEEYEPQVEFKPLVKLEEVEVKTGEENEEALFKQRCKLYRYDSNLKEWKEKGTGEIKILKHKTNENMFRILMRRDQVLKLCANHRITNELKWEIVNEKQVRWYAQDYSENEGKHELLAVRFKLEEDAKKFKQVCEDCQKVISSDVSVKKPNEANEKKVEEKNICQGLKPSLSAMFKKEGWECKDCYVFNKEEATKCAACQSVRKDANGKPVEQKKTPQTTVTQAEPPKFSFGSQNQTTTVSFGQTFGTKPIGTLFGTQKIEPKTEESKTVENIFGAKSAPTFADLAKTPSGFTGGFTGGFSGGFGGAFGGQNNQPTSLFGAKPAPVFGGQVAKTEDGDEEGGDNQNPEEYEPQVEFKPLVKLEEVQVKSGEEDEEVLFKQRCKLYRFDSKNKEWKEKGAGDIKILKHRIKENSYRILMRRDQVLKLCANHRITPEIKLEVVNEKQLRWLANDCSEGEPQTELLTVRFRHEEDAKKFKDEFEKAQQNAKISTSGNVENKNKIQPVQQVKNDLANSIKTEQGSWNCSACLTLNKPNAVKCACCQSDKPSTNVDKNDDLEIVFTAKPTEEQVDKARSLGLPDTFYLYLDKPNCKGCIGCENEQ